MPLTNTQLRNAKPKDKPHKLPKELGLFLIANPNNSKWWCFPYNFQGKAPLLHAVGLYM